ncbi:MAG: hypothetical protein ACI4UO_00330, partial [Paludibacteraceae bacterium]
MRSTGGGGDISVDTPHEIAYKDTTIHTPFANFSSFFFIFFIIEYESAVCCLSMLSQKTDKNLQKRKNMP